MLIELLLVLKHFPNPTENGKILSRFGFSGTGQACVAAAARPELECVESQRLVNRSRGTNRADLADSWLAAATSSTSSAQYW